MLTSKLGSDQRVRFVLAGGVNTAVGYFAFVIVELAFGNYIGYLLSLYVAHFFVSTIAFLIYKRKVFQAEGFWLKDYFRFQSVYIVPIVANTFMLPMMVSVLNWNLYAAQALSTVIIAIASYFGHKHFSFRRSNSSQSEAKNHGTNEISDV